MDTWVEEQLAAEPDESLRSVKHRLIILQTRALESASSSTTQDLFTICAILALDHREAYLYHGHQHAEWRTAVEAVPLTSWVKQKAVKLLLKWVRSGRLPTTACTVEDVAALAAEMLRPGRISPAVVATASTDSNPTVAIVEDAGGEGNGSLRVQRPVKAFSPLLTVPADQLFNTDTVRRRSDLGFVLSRASWKQRLDDAGEAFLLCCLVYERLRLRAGASSHWHQLLRTCPSKFPFIPTAFDAWELQALDGTSVLDDVAAKNAELQSFVSSLQTVLGEVAAAHSPVFDSLQPLVTSSTDEASSPLHTAEGGVAIAALFSLEEFQWARCVVDSRAFHLLYPGDRILLTLAPMADMVNHTGDGTMVLTRRIDEETGALVFETGYALDESDVGHEVTMSYGPLQKWELLHSYGFVPKGQDNMYDRLPFAQLRDMIVAEQTEEDDGYGEQRNSIVRRHHLDLVPQLFIPHSGVPPPTLLAVLRLTQAEIEHFPALHVNPFDSSIPELEACVYESLRMYAQSVVDSATAVIDAFGTDSEDGEDSDGVAESIEETAEEAGANTLREQRIECALELQRSLRQIATRLIQYTDKRRLSTTE